MKQVALSIALLLAVGAPASAAELMSVKPAPQQDVCELTCTYKEGTGPKRITTCTQRMTDAQCKAVADHKNTSDAYPNKMICTAKLNESCETAREF